MFTPGWIIGLLLLTAPLSLCSFDIIQDDREVTCSEGLRECTMKDGTAFDFNSVEVSAMSVSVKLCCRGDTCALCLLFKVQVNLTKMEEDESNSGLKDDDSADDDEDETCAVTVCYKTPQAMPKCKKVKFMVNPARPSQQSTAQISMTVTNAAISYEDLLYIDSPNVPNINIEINVPSLINVCSSDISTYVQECNAPKMTFLTNKLLNEVELSFVGSNSSLTEVCIQNEINGNCKSWNRKPIPLESLTPCTCFQAWREEERQTVRSRSCPFKNNITLRPYIWKNVTLSVQKGFYNSSTSLLWNVSAPCRFEGELWPCERTPGFTVCTEMKGFKQPLENVSWIQNSKGVWEKTGIFAKINLKNDPCVMLQIKGMEGELGPFCYNSIDRWRWSLFAVAAMLLFSVTLLVTFYLRNFVKKSVIWSRCHGGLVKIHQAHVLVLSPPDSSGEVSSAVCSLGSLLYSSGFSVTVDQWSRRSQLSSGPLPWAHCQLLSIDRKCERVLLVLSPRALDRAQNWSSQDSAASDQQEESPYSDVFRASLFAIQAYKNQGRARERFVLVTFDSQWTEAKICHNELPEILQGLPLFHFPSQTKALLADLCVGRTKRQTKRTQTWGFSGDRYKDCAVSLNSKTCETETKLLKH
ncbi:interleukin-17 receptor C [Periophthalmus magnuspinnatus]|uniref:interleukin-17 receptor C n=1 Tax=Periophthalmus magnuspinnatus TaxID=409849 RepID=UPI00145B9F44|nr:interleukin-17 receptor C [Periophthalmus magnuspinnatus]